MNDMSKTIAPKSDQLNSDDLIAGPMTVRVREVSVGTGEQPASIFFDGDGGRPFKPCKSMRRVLVNIWGKDGNQYAGRSMTLFRDPKVKWGGDEVGGIRISHMSDMKGDVEMALTVTRGSRKPYKVRPLASTAAQIPSAALAASELIDEGNEATERGTEVLKAFWSRMTKPQQLSLKGYLDGWKARAAEVDAANAPDASSELPEDSAKLSNIFNAG